MKNRMGRQSVFFGGIFLGLVMIFGNERAKSSLEAAENVASEQAVEKAVDKEMDKAETQDFPHVPAAKVVAHRGFSAIAPENTLSSVREAVNIQANGCEVDLYSTTDGVLFLAHDANLKRTTGYDKNTAECSWAELQTLDFGLWKGEKYRGEKVATLDEMLDLLQGTATRPVLEIKQDGIVEAVVRTVEKHDMIPATIIIDFSAKRVKQARLANPELCVAWLCGFEKELSPAEIATIIIDQLKECDTNVVDIQYDNVSPELLKLLSDAGIHVWCWTVDRPDDIDRLLDWGVESVTSNCPNLVLESLKSRKSANPEE